VTRFRVNRRPSWERRADLGHGDGLNAWRDMVIAQAASGEGKGGCPLGSLAGQLAGTDPHARAPLAAGFRQWRAAISDGLRRLHQAGQLPDGTDPTPSRSLSSPRSGAAFSWPRSSGMPAPWKRRSTPLLQLARTSCPDIPASKATPAT
jgi:hypothetical protein